MAHASTGIMPNAKMPLNPNIKILWSLNYLAAFLITFLIFYAFEALMGSWDAFISEFLLQLAFVAIFAAFVFLYYIELKYKGYYYMITDTEIIFRKGIFNTVKTVVPFKEIQNLNISKSILERALGISNLRIETAGSNIVESEVVIPGVENEDELSGMIRKKIEGVKANGSPASAPSDPILFEHPEDKGQDLEGLGKRMADLESRLDAIARKSEKRDIDTENLKESEEAMHAEMRLIHSSMAKLMRSSDETALNMDKISRLMAKLTIGSKLKRK
jgi:membrane protein YdbS with pleckstrin-like domain